MRIRLIIDRLTGKAIMAGDKAIAVRSTDALNVQQTSTLSQADYDALATKDTTTLYLISGTSGYVKAYIGDSPLYREPEPRTVSGTSAVVFSSIDGGAIKSLVRYGKCEQGSVPCVTAITQLGKCEQNGTPTPSAPVDIVCNNGAIKVSPNLANMVSGNIVVGQYIDNTGTARNDTANFFYSPLIPVDATKTYTMHTSVSLAYLSIMEYGSNKGFLRRTLYGSSSVAAGDTITFTLSADCAFIRFGSNIKKSAISESDVLAVNWMLTQTATAQDFRPYGEIYVGGTHPGQNLVDLTAVTDGYYYDTSGVYAAAPNARLTDFIPVKGGQKYTVYVKALQSGSAVVVRCNLFDITKTWKSQPSFAVNSGSEAVGVITPTENGYLRVSANYAGTGAKADWSKLQIVRGEYTLATMPPYEPYTEVPYTPEVLTVRGKNLLDPSTSNIKIGQLVTVNGEITSLYPNNWRSDYIPVVGGKTYAFWGRTKNDNTISAYNRINWFTANKTHIYPRPSYTDDTVTVGTAPSNAAFAILSCSPYKSGAAITRATFDEFNWMFAEASAEIPYQPYVTPQTVTDIPMLLGVGNYKDEVELVGGIKTGKVGIKVFDGTETFTVSSSGAMITAIPDVAVGAQNTPMNTHFALETSPTSIAVGTQRFGASGTAIYSANYYMKHTTITTVADFQAWLASEYANGTPVIVLYPLATETTGQTTAHPELTNGKYAAAYAEGNVDDITVTVTRGVTSTPTPYTPIPIICNNGEVTGQGASGTPEALTLRGINLLDNTGRFPASGTWEYGYYKDFASGNGAIPPIHLEAGKTYTLSLNVTSSVTPVGISAGCGNGTYATDIEATEATSQGGRVSITFTPTAAQLANGDLFAFRAPRTDTADSFDYSVSEVQLEEGPSATPYEPYVAPQTASVVDLLQVGGVKDEQDVITGEVARRCAACLYDGTQEVGDTYISNTGGKDIGAVIVYPLATPATEQVTPQPLICHMGSNTVESVCNVSDPEISIIYPE